MVDTDTITLITCDGKKFEITNEHAAISGVINIMVENHDDDDGAAEINMPDITAETLSKVLDYLKYHKTVELPEISMPLKSMDMKENVPKWDATFVDLTKDQLHKLLLAANFLDIKPLINLCCAKIATIVNGLTLEEQCEFFNIKNELTPEEQAEEDRMVAEDMAQLARQEEAVEEAQ